MKQINITKKNFYSYFFKEKETINFSITKDCEIEIKSNNSNLKLNFDVINAQVDLRFFLQGKVTMKQKLNLKKAKVNLYQLNLLAKINQSNKILLDESEININHKGFTKEKIKNKMDIVHYTSDSKSKADCLVIADNSAKADLLIATHVKKHCKNAQALQKTKVIALSKKVSARLQPILKTDHHKINAQHAAIFSKVTDEEIYYLQTRGLNKKEAKELIVKSLLITDNVKYYQEIEEMVI